MANTVIPQGSKEYFFVDVDDFLDTLTDMTGHSASFSVKDSTNALLLTNVSVSNISSADGGLTSMRCWCLIDTSANGQAGAGSAWNPGEYRLYLKAIIGSEVPIIGPLAFSVSAA